MKAKIVIVLLIPILFASCKKNRNEKQFIGTYTGEWHYEDIHSDYDTTGIFTYSEEETIPGTFTITREGKYALLNVSGLPTTQKIEIKELGKDELFNYHSPTAGPFGSAQSYSTWKLTFSSDTLKWESKYAGSGMFATTNIKRFTGVKME